MLYMLNDLNVPETAYKLNARDEIMIDLEVKNKYEIEDLEYQTGIYLEHYYKLKIEQIDCNILRTIYLKNNYIVTFLRTNIYCNNYFRHPRF